MMAYSGLLVFLILTASKMGAVAGQCSTQQLPGSSSSGSSGFPDLQQVTTIPYCIIDDCIIENLKTGQILDVIFTIDNLLVVIPKGNQTAQVIAKSGKQFLCHSVDEVFWALLSTGTQLVVMMLISGYIITVNLLVKNSAPLLDFSSLCTTLL